MNINIYRVDSNRHPVDVDCHSNSYWHLRPRLNDLGHSELLLLRHRHHLKKQQIFVIRPTIHIEYQPTHHH